MVMVRQLFRELRFLNFGSKTVHASYKNGITSAATSQRLKEDDQAVRKSPDLAGGPAASGPEAVSFLVASKAWLIAWRKIGAIRPRSYLPKAYQAIDH